MVFGAIFEVNSNSGKLWDSLEHFDKEDTVDFWQAHIIFQFVTQFYTLRLEF